MSPQAIAAALETDPEDVFRTEVLCQWVTAVGGAISPAVWQALADPEAPRDQSVVFALDVAPDHSSATLAVAWERSDGAVQVEVADHQDGVAAVVDHAADLCRRWGGRVVVEQSGTAAFLIPQLEQAGVTVDAVPRRFYADACSALDAAVSGRQVRHGNETPFADAVAHWTSSGDAGQRLLSRKHPHFHRWSLQPWRFTPPHSRLRRGPARSCRSESKWAEAAPTIDNSASCCRPAAVA